MKASKIITLTALYACTNFTCQPPQPPKPPAKKAVLSDDNERRAPLPPSWSPAAPLLAMYQSRSKKDGKTTYNGILQTNQNGGCLNCKVTYDPATDSYSGEKINDGYTEAEWYSSSINPDQAKAYYLDLFKQDPDRKDKMG